GVFFFFSSRRRHTRFSRDWSSDVCSSDLAQPPRSPSGSVPQLAPELAALRSRGHGSCLADAPASDNPVSTRVSFSISPCSSATRSEERRVGKERRSRWAPGEREDIQTGSP